MDSLRAALDREAERTRFSGVVRVDRGGTTQVMTAYGLADRAHGIAMTPAHQLGTASVTKGFTALTILSIVSEGSLELATRARSVLGGDLPLIDDEVTVEHLLSHRSGIGDYLDESSIASSADYVMPVPVHRLETARTTYRCLTGARQSRSREALSRTTTGASSSSPSSPSAWRRRHFTSLSPSACGSRPAWRHTAFLRSDELPATAAVGYLDADGPRTNVLHLPVRGSGDGGAFTTVSDMGAFWDALLAGRIVSERWVAEMLVPRHEPVGREPGYGLGVWLHAGGVLELHGYDAGVSFRSCTTQRPPAPGPSGQTRARGPDRWRRSSWPTFRSDGAARAEARASRWGGARASGWSG